MKEKILVTSANGHVGLPTARELLALGFKVRAFVRNPNGAGAKELKHLGAEIFVGNQDDVADLRESLKGVQRAFYCAPATPNHLFKTVAFVVAAEQERLEHVVYLTQWLSSENHHSPHTKEHWLGDEVIKMHKKVNFTIVNPGLFAFSYFFTNAVVAHFGMLPTPIKNASQGKVGLNAPPSEEDQGRVVAYILKDPNSHVGKTYRPTGPKLISILDVSNIFGKILGKKIKINEVSRKMYLKSLKSMDVEDHLLINVPYYQDELERNAFAFGPSAVTSVVKDLTGVDPEDFETIARREFAKSPEMEQTLANKFKALRGFMKILLTGKPDVRALEDKNQVPRFNNGHQYVQENPNWVKQHESQLSKI